MSVWIGPDSVPWRVTQTSIVPGMWLIRFMTLSCSPFMSLAFLFQPASSLIKKVVRPESP